MLAWLRGRRTPSPTPNGAPSATDALFDFLTRQVTSPERAASVLAEVERARTLAPTEREAALPRLYLLFEQYLVEVDPHPRFERAELRDHVRQRHAELLPLPRFALIFQPAAAQELLLRKVLLGELLGRAFALLGATGDSSLPAATAWLEAVPDAAAGPPPFGLTEQAPRDEREWTDLLRQVSRRLYERVEGALGDQVAGRMFRGAYRELAAAYAGLDTFGAVVDLLPDKLLDAEMIGLLSRAQIQRVLVEKVEDLDSARADLETRVLARTAELRSANAQLTAEIARRGEIEAALRDSEERYRIVVQTAPYAILTIDEESTILFANLAAEEIFGRRAEAMIGEPLTILMPEHLRELHLAAFRRYLASGEKGLDWRSIELVGQRADGELVPLELSIGEFTRDGRRLFTGVLRDVSERRAAAEALRHSEEQLRQAQKMEAVGRLAGGVAHDFNNLLTIVTGFSELVLVRTPMDDASRQYVEQIKKAGERATALTGQLLAYSRQQVLAPELLDLNEAVASTEQMLGRVIGEDVELVTALDPALGPVNADRGQIGQVIMNLAVNARDAMPRGGKLVIATRNVELAAPALGTYGTVPPGDYVMLEVADTGTGMDEATQARIFDPFFTTKERGKGTGLGLSTVYGIVAQTGGHIRVDSALGQGTTFRIYLPRVQAAALAAAPAGEAPAAVVGGVEIILLVEDEDDVRLLVQRVLRDCGYTVLEASGGEAALAVAGAHSGPIDLLLTDVVMPGMSGPDLAERLRLARPNTVVLFMSGYTDHPAVHQAAGSAGHAFLQKPFTPEALARIVRQRLDGRRGAAEAARPDRLPSATPSD